MKRTGKCKHCREDFIGDLLHQPDNEFKTIFLKLIPVLKSLACKYCKSLIPFYEPFGEAVYGTYVGINDKKFPKTDGERKWFIASCVKNHLIDLCKNESRYRKFLKEHQEEIARWFQHPPAYPPEVKPEDRFDWNYQGIQLLDKAVKDKVLTKIEAEVLAEHICYDRPFSRIAQEQKLSVKEVINHYETAFKKLKR